MEIINIDGCCTFCCFLTGLQAIVPKYFPELVASMLTGIKGRFEPILKKEEYVVPTVLDPRQKLKLFNRKLNFGFGLNSWK